jgi:Plasmid pRiA4b ORF-3-like protein
MPTTVTDVMIYQLKVVLLGISPMIWPRLLVHGDSTIADLHYILQIALGWTDTHLHQFRIQGKKYGIAQIGGIGFRDNPHQVRLADLGLRLGECFFYDYDFGDHWQHQLRVEAILTPEPNRGYPVWVAGQRACPPEDCGGSWAFMALRQQYSVFHIAQRLEEIIENDDRSEYVEELHDLRYWLTVDRFDRTTVNRRLSQYACGDEAWQWE